MLSRQTILNLIKNREIVLEPFEEENLGVDSIDVRLHETILVSRNKNTIIDPKSPTNFWEEIKIPDEGFILMPGQFILGSTLEKIGLAKNIAAQIEGRSTIGRLGIMVHVTAGVIHAGFGLKNPSRITLEIYSVNPNPVKLYKGMKIAQLSFFRLDKAVKLGYDELPSSKYTNLQKPLPPKPI